jgi:hypothetical protein
MLDALTPDALPPAHLFTPPGDGPSYRLSKPALTVAVGFAMLYYRGQLLGSDECPPGLLNAFWREDAEEVAATVARIVDSEWWDEMTEPGDLHGLRSATLRKMLRPLPQRPKKGLTVAALAERAGVPRETMACALEHHGFLQTVPFGGEQRRRLVTDLAFAAGYGHNVDAMRSRSARLDGHHRATVFPVLYAECADAVLWTLDFDGIRQLAAECPTKRQRIAWLLGHHGYLPSVFLAELAGCSERGVRKARGRMEAKVPSQVKEGGIPKFCLESGHWSDLATAHWEPRVELPDGLLAWVLEHLYARRGRVKA